MIWGIDNTVYNPYTTERKEKYMYTAINSVQIDEDYPEIDIDRGDYEYCGDCDEWTVPMKERMVMDDHRVTIVYTCKCGNIIKEEV